MLDYLPYMVSVLCALISGFASYAISRKQSKEDLKKIEKQYELDLEKEREQFQMQKEKLEIEHKYQMELKQKEIDGALNNNLTNTLISEVMKIPEVRQQINKGMRESQEKKR